MIRRLVLFFILTALLVAATVWLVDHPGAVVITWTDWAEREWRVDTYVPILILATGCILVVVAAVVWLLNLLLKAPRRFAARRRTARLHEGYRALSDGLAAVATGDPRRARKLAHRAERLLDDPSMTSLLTAQAAEISGNQAEAWDRFQAMTERPETALLGLKGLLGLALKRDDRPKALDLAQRAWSMGGTASGDLASTLFELQVQAGAWDEAQVTINEARKRKALSGAELLHNQAVLHLEHSRRVETSGATKAAMKLALKAHFADPMMVPAATYAASLLHRLGKNGKAMDVLLSTWRASPHPALVEAALALAPGESVPQKMNRLKKLLQANPTAAEGHIALGEMALARSAWGEARTHLELAAAHLPSPRVFSLLARLERDEKNDEAAAEEWLHRAATAPAECAWVCSACSRQSPVWTLICPSCGTVDGIEWRKPFGARNALAVV